MKLKELWWKEEGGWKGEGLEGGGYCVKGSSGGEGAAERDLGERKTDELLQVSSMGVNEEKEGMM